MALTDIQKTIAFDANKSLKAEIDNLTTMVGTNGLCIPIATAYKGLVQTVNTMVVPVGHFHDEIIQALDENDVVTALETASQTLDITGIS